MQAVSEYMTVTAYAADRRVSPRSIYNWIRDGKIAVRSLNGLMVVPVDANAQPERKAA